MTRDDRRPGDAEYWKTQQDQRNDEYVRQFLAKLKEDQGKVQRAGDFNHALEDLSHFMDNLADHLGADNTQTHQQVGVPSHHDTVVQADHGLATDLYLPAALVVSYVVQQLAEAVNFVIEQKELIDEKTVDERTVAETKASVAEMWDRFTDSITQFVEVAERQQAELASPGKAQDQPPLEQDRARDAATHEPDQVQPDKEMAELLAKQEKERADQAAQIQQQREKFADSPDKLNALSEVAKEVQDQTAAKHAAEIQKLMEQRALQQQRQLSAPQDPNRTR
jgi:hypothetical protein